MYQITDNLSHRVSVLLLAHWISILPMRLILDNVIYPLLLVEKRGIEPRTEACKATAFPITPYPLNF